ncbi:MAG: hypothetical protein AAFO96_29790, partial [Bacteroidota bacterium]
MAQYNSQRHILHCYAGKSNPVTFAGCNFYFGFHGPMNTSATSEQNQLVKNRPIAEKPTDTEDSLVPKF